MSISVDLVVTLTEAVNLQREALRSMVSTKGRWLAVDDESSVGHRCGLPSHNLVTNIKIKRQKVNQERITQKNDADMIKADSE
ncbi:hypothetical protein N7519_010321 [Penicillium mononematosum]|uniref:uncharacterized protein n=1 Tax=Penicillium mononematosum TaxID=268346 RepID=UPI0025492A2D|nr:uncharacterized protein N7519_010321 [Penicillium mononematosum]KAJ6179860.1 hypothetical protein N7519_010321 [Penicillium mononematosum]